MDPKDQLDGRAKRAKQDCQGCLEKLDKQANQELSAFLEGKETKVSEDFQD